MNSPDIPTVPAAAESHLKTILLLNPNTSQATTDRMLDAARRQAGDGFALRAITAPFGEALITDERALRIAAGAVLHVSRHSLASPPDGVIVAAFGDPGLEDVRSIFNCPVVGIAEASMAEAATGGRRFAVATTTPLLEDAIRMAAYRYGVGDLLTSVRTTSEDPNALMRDPGLLLAALHDEVKKAVECDGAGAVIIGGGPLSGVARELTGEFAVPVIEPVPAAIRGIAAKLNGIADLSSPC